MIIEIIALFLVALHFLLKKKLMSIQISYGDPVHVAFGMWLAKLSHTAYTSSSIPLAVVVFILSFLYLAYQVLEDIDQGTKTAYKDILTFTASFAATLGALIGVQISL